MLYIMVTDIHVIILSLHNMTLCYSSQKSSFKIFGKYLIVS